jgi:DNA (cytosine-5)-methyltransferase 1
MCRLQGLPEDFADELPFTTHGKRKVIGNGVPLTLGRPIARAVKRAMGKEAAA